jgi:atrial natriuretic peptide receptor A
MWVHINLKNSSWGDHGWYRNDTNDTQAKQAYQSLLRVSLLQPRDPEFKSFADDVRELAQKEYNYTFSEAEEVS